MSDEILVFRLQGPQSLAQAVDAVEQCLRDARAAGATRVLVNALGLTGFAAPDLLSRLDLVRRWAAAAGGRMKVALVCPPELTDSERFGVVVARGMGFDGDEFETEEEARLWLEQQPALWTGPPPEF